MPAAPGGVMARGAGGAGAALARVGYLAAIRADALALNVARVERRGIRRLACSCVPSPRGARDQRKQPQRGARRNDDLHPRDFAHGANARGPYDL